MCGIPRNAAHGRDMALKEILHGKAEIFIRLKNKIIDDDRMN